jgi:hypothetical protein
MIARIGAPRGLSALTPADAETLLTVVVVALLMFVFATDTRRAGFVTPSPPVDVDCEFSKHPSTGREGDEGCGGETLRSGCVTGLDAFVGDFERCW